MRAALDLVDAVRVLGPGIQARAGVLTGEAAVTLGATNQGMVAGDLVNTAARLQSVAAPGTVLVGEATKRAASGAIAFEPAGDQALKGKASPSPPGAPCAWWPSAAVRAGSDLPEPPFVGRDEELRLLKDLIARDRARSADAARLDHRTGGHRQEPARLGAREVHRRHQRDDLLASRPLARLRRGDHVLGPRRDGPPARRPGRDRRRGDDPRADRGDGRRVRPDARTIGAGSSRRCSTLLGLEPAPAGGRDVLFAAWRIFFERIAERGTTVLLFEDLQWADSGLLDFIEHLLEWSKGVPLLVVTLARPELFDRRPDWGAGRPATSPGWPSSR